jgi:rsbT co-antagonist protein RsbR
VLDNIQQSISALTTADPTGREEIGEQLEEWEAQFEQTEAQIDLLNASETNRIQATIGTELDQNLISIVLLLMICILFSLSILMIIHRIVVRPVQHLALAFEQVANGAAPTPTAVTSNDEIGALQRHFNSMIATLQRQSISITQQVQAAETARTASEAAEREAASRLAIIEEQRETIRDMSVPVLPLDKQSLVMPLIGTLDTQRLTQIQEQALRWLESSRARRLLLDITGVPIIDSQVAQGLIRVVHAARLLGAEVVLVGIRPEVAQTIVSLGLDLRDIKTFSSLQAGIA